MAGRCACNRPPAMQWRFPWMQCPSMAVSTGSLLLQWLVRDVSQQVQAEEALRQSEQLLRSFVDQSLDGIALTDEQGQVIEWNPTMEQITGLPAMETIGRPIWELQLLLDGDVDAAAGYRAQIGDRFRELLRSGQAPWLGQLMERTYVHPDGARRVVQGVVFPFRTRKGFMLGSISRDVTDLKRAEEALRQSESKYRMLVESLHEGIWFIDEAGDTTFVNPAMAQLLGYTVDEMVNVHLRGFVNQVDVEAVDAQLERRRQGISENLDFELRRKDGTQLFVNLNATPIFDASGAYAGALASVRDITQERWANEERQRLLDQLLEDRRRITAISVQEQRQAQELGAILQAIPDAVAVWDTQGTVIRANPAAMALGIGTEKAGMVEVAAHLEVRHADGRPIAAEELPVARALRGEVIRNEAEILVSPDGEEHEILVSVAPVFSGDEIIGCVVVSHDITDKRQVEKERERLLSENRSQREFPGAPGRSRASGDCRAARAGAPLRVGQPLLPAHHRRTRHAYGWAHHHRGHTRPGQPADAPTHGRGLSHRPDREHQGSQVVVRAWARGDVLEHRSGAAARSRGLGGRHPCPGPRGDRRSEDSRAYRCAERPGAAAGRRVGGHLCRAGRTDDDLRCTK